MPKDPRGHQLPDTVPSDLQPLSPLPSDFQPLSGAAHHAEGVQPSALVSPSQTPARATEQENRAYARRATDTKAYQELEVTVRHLRRQVKLIMDSLPSMSVDEHSEHHEDYSSRLKERKEKEEEDKKLKKELKSKLVKTIAQAVFMAFMVVLGLGLQAQFSRWVNQAVEEKATATAKHPPEGDKK
jgi:hypothetical protein